MTTLSEHFQDNPDDAKLLVQEILTGEELKRFEDPRTLLDSELKTCNIYMEGRSGKRHPNPIPIDVIMTEAYAVDPGGYYAICANAVAHVMHGEVVTQWTQPPARFLEGYKLERALELLKEVLSHDPTNGWASRHLLATMEYNGMVKQYSDYHRQITPPGWTFPPVVGDVKDGTPYPGQGEDRLSTKEQT